MTGERLEVRPEQRNQTDGAIVGLAQRRGQNPFDFRRPANPFVRDIT